MEKQRRKEEEAERKRLEKERKAALEAEKKAAKNKSGSKVSWLHLTDSYMYLLVKLFCHFCSVLF